MTAHSDIAPPAAPPSPLVVVPALGVVQLLMWGSTVYLLAVLAPAIVADTGWSLRWVIAGVSLGLLVAGLISPQVGRAVDRWGGRPVLATSAVFASSAFATLALAPSLPVYFLGWILMGLGMGTGLYDAAFAALGRLYGEKARSAITNLTLFGGFGSTLCWPLSAFMVATWDWRTACIVYAVLHIMALPIHLLVFPREVAKSAERVAAERAQRRTVAALTRDESVMFWLLAGLQTLAQAIGTIVIVHLLVFLQARGLTLAAAVALGTLFGPAQVGARVIERLFGNYYHPIWTMIAASAGMTVGLAMLLVDLPLVAAAVLVYGAGYGVTWIARGTLPLAIFGSERYPVLIGRLAFPSLIAQAASPFAGALMIEGLGAMTTVSILTVAAALNLALALALWRLARRAQKAASV
jgi:MFS family permease